MRYCFIFIAFVSLLCSCKGTQPVDDADVLVKVKDRTLRRCATWREKIRRKWISWWRNIVIR